VGKYHRKALYFSLQPFFGEMKKMVSKAVACSLSWNIIRTFKKYGKVHPKKKRCLGRSEGCDSWCIIFAVCK